MKTRATPRATGESALLDAARAAARHAHAPYSRFHVGAALRTAAGGVFSGCNVENASYGLTMCAERNAIAAAVAAEGPGMRIACLAVTVDAAEAFSPCGACRQVIAEFAAPETVIIYGGTAGPPVRTTAAELLPQAFRLR
jgi:cytidine deaminase